MGVGGVVVRSGRSRCLLRCRREGVTPVVVVVVLEGGGRSGDGGRRLRMGMGRVKGGEGMSDGGGVCLSGGMGQLRPELGRVFVPLSQAPDFVGSKMHVLFTSQHGSHDP